MVRQANGPIEKLCQLALAPPQRSLRQAGAEGWLPVALGIQLIELNDKDKLIRPGMRILDLGSAPGGWSQVAGKIIGDKGRVLATDILPMEALRNVDFIQGDFTEEAVLQQLLDWLGGGKFDLIISDIAPTSPASTWQTRRPRCISSSSPSTPCARH